VRPVILDPKQGGTDAKDYGPGNFIHGDAVMGKTIELLSNTDPLAQIAIGGLAITIVVSIGLFLFVMTRRNAPRR
jgi:hypothetical protein